MQNISHKICPQCQQPAVLDMKVCQRCGRAFRTPPEELLSPSVMHPKSEITIPTRIPLRPNKRILALALALALPILAGLSIITIAPAIKTTIQHQAAVEGYLYKPLIDDVILSASADDYRYFWQQVQFGTTLIGPGGRSGTGPTINRNRLEEMRAARRIFIVPQMTKALLLEKRIDKNEYWAVVEIIEGPDTGIQAWLPQSAFHLKGTAPDADDPDRGRPAFQ